MGPSHAGKTSIVRALTGKTFQAYCKQTIGADLTKGPINYWDVQEEILALNVHEGLFKMASMYCLIIPSNQDFDPEVYFTYLERVKDKPVQLVISHSDFAQEYQSFSLLSSIQRFIADAKQKQVLIADDVIEVSAKYNRGISELNDAIHTSLGLRDANARESAVSLASRHSFFSRPTSRVLPPPYEPYSKVCEKAGSDPQAQAIALLNDYCKGTIPGLSPFLVLLHGHFGRHYTSKVRANLIALRENKKNLDEVLDELNQIQGKNEQGSLNRRLQYIRDFLITNDQESDEGLIPDATTFD